MAALTIPASASLGLQAAGALSGAIGGFYSSKQQKNQLKFEAEMADINARIAELGARSAFEKGQKEVASLTLQAGQVKAKQRTAMAANNVDLGTGSAAEVQASTDIMKTIDVQTLEANALKSAWGYRTEGVNWRTSAMMKRGSADGISPGASAATSLLGSAGSVASQWYFMTR